jgi:hypothetical protein
VKVCRTSLVVPSCAHHLSWLRNVECGKRAINFPPSISWRHVEKLLVLISSVSVQDVVRMKTGKLTTETGRPGKFRRMLMQRLASFSGFDTRIL